ncbi:MAG: hypothetical protein AB1468_01675 [Candidatus Micrarchaeota archaeon]
MNFELPNIYAGDYRKLAVIPLALILLSLYLIFFVGLPRGIDLKGGTLISLTTNSSFNEGALKDALGRELKAREVMVNSYPVASGTGLEIELEQDEHLALAEKNLAPFHAKVTEANAYEVDILGIETRLRNATPDIAPQLEKELAEYRGRLASTRADANSYADIIISNTEFILGRKLEKSEDLNALEALLSNYSSEARAAYKARIFSVIERQGLEFDASSASFKYVSPSLSELFLQKAVNVVMLSAVLTIIVVFIVFRTVVPSLAVLSGAVSDVVIAMGGMVVFNIPLTLPSFAALLMLIGFSLDTDMLLTIRTLKRTEGTARERAYETMKTGLTMSGAAILAFSALFVLSMVTHISTYYQISAVAICGLVGDIFATWGINAVIILWYIEHRRHGHEHEHAHAHG